MNIAIVEVGGSHDECLYAQIRYIAESGDHKVTLYYTKQMQLNVSYFDKLDHKVEVYIADGIKKMFSIYNLRKLLIKGDYDAIIFNTAHGKTIQRLLLLPFPKKTKLYGIAHNITKLQSSGTQKLITQRLESYFLLNTYLKEKLDDQPRNKIKTSVFYPIFFPDYPIEQIDKKEGEIWICIPGQVEMKRRDYAALFDAIEKDGIGAHIRIILLGRCQHEHGDGEYIHERIEALGVQSNFIIFNDFIPIEQYHGILNKSDYIAFLIHSNHPSFELYTNQITGAINLAIAYHKPVLLEQGVYNHDDFNGNAVYYDLSEMMKLINGLSPTLNRTYFNEKKWSFEHQQKCYMDVLLEQNGL